MIRLLIALGAALLCSCHTARRAEQYTTTAASRSIERTARSSDTAVAVRTSAADVTIDSIVHTVIISDTVRTTTLYGIAAASNSSAEQITTHNADTTHIIVVDTIAAAAAATSQPRSSRIPSATMLIITLLSLTTITTLIILWHNYIR